MKHPSPSTPLELAPTDAEVKDQDDAALARAEPTTELLLPSGWPASFSDRFSLIVSKRAFSGYAQQPSPCCAAASVAGAVNGALGQHASADGALTHLHIAGLLHAMLAEQAEKKRASLLRLLGVPSLEPAFDALRADLAKDGRSLGGKKELGCTAKDGLARLATLCEEHAPPAAEPDGAAGEMTAANEAVLSEEARMWRALADVMPPKRGAGEEGGAEEEEEEEELISTVSLAKEEADGGFGKKVRTPPRAALDVRL